MVSNGNRLVKGTMPSRHGDESIKKSQQTTTVQFRQGFVVRGRTQIIGSSKSRQQGKEHSAKILFSLVLNILVLLEHVLLCWR